MALLLGSLRMRRVAGFVSLRSSVIVAAASSFAYGQNPGAGAPETAQAPAASRIAEGDAGAAEDSKQAESGSSLVDKLQWPEPRRQELLRNEFKELPTTLLVDRERTALVEMARGQGAFDAALIRKYVNSYAAELTKHVNIAAMLGTDSTARNQKAMDEAAGRLLQPLLEPATAANATFRREYANALLAQAPALLQGHMLTRTFYMVVLSRAGSEDLVPLLIEQVRDPEQTYMVKLLAAVGLTNISQNGRKPPEASSRAIPAAKAIADFLRVAPPDAPWPVVCRNLEALGSLRQSAGNPLSGQADIADVAFELLSRRDVDPQVRIWAGWALSRLQYPATVRDLNLDTVAYLLSETAVYLSEQATQIPLKGGNLARNQRLVARVAESLLRILESFTGTSEIRGSGLTPLSRESAYVRALEQRVRAVASNCLDLSQAVGTQAEPTRNALAESALQLRTYLQQNPPKGHLFYAGGPEMAIFDAEAGTEKAPSAPDGEVAGAR